MVRREASDAATQQKTIKCWIRNLNGKCRIPNIPDVTEWLLAFLDGRSCFNIASNECKMHTVLSVAHFGREEMWQVGRCCALFVFWKYFSFFRARLCSTLLRVQMCLADCYRYVWIWIIFYCLSFDSKFQFRGNFLFRALQSTLPPMTARRQRSRCNGDGVAFWHQMRCSAYI